jgi:anti-sigma factor RsiW
VNCSEIETLINAYVDGELDAGHVFEVEQHLHGCQACDQVYQSSKNMHERLQNGNLAYPAPTGLRERIQLALPSDQPKPRSRSTRTNWNWPALAASLLLGIIAGGTAVEFMPGSRTPPIAEQLLSSHVRSQMFEKHLVDVRSTDQHEVKPWFQGKLDFSPPVHDLADLGYPLVGGRLDYIDGRPVAALVYQRRKHLINLFVWPVAAHDERALSLTRQGYHFIHWIDSNTNYWAVSDLNMEELDEFAKLVKETPR